MFRFALLSVCLIMLSGCASNKVWLNPSKNDAEAKKDFRECKYDSEKSSFVPYGNDTSPISAGIQEGFQSVSLMSSCMHSRGYSLVDKSKHTDDIRYNKNLSDEISAALKAEDYNKVLMIADPKKKEVPMNADIYAIRCQAYRELGNFKEAIDSCNYAVKIGESNLHAINQKAITLAEYGEPEIGLELMNVAISMNQRSSYLYNNRAYILNMMSKYDRAIEDCNKSMALESLSESAYKNRGNSYVGLKDYENAIKSFNKAISINDKYAKAYVGRAEAYLKMGKTDNATSDFKKACEYGNKGACLKVK